MSDKKKMSRLEKERKSLIARYGGRHFTNMLDEMMSMQKSFGKKFCDFDNLSKDEQVKWTKEYIHCCQDELSEILNWLPWKHWKKYKDFNLEQTEIKYELIDLWHFLMNMMLVWKMTPEDVFTTYIIKNRENHARQKRGY